MTNHPKSPTSNTEKFKQSTTEETKLGPCPFDGGDEIVVGSRSDGGPYVRCFFCDTYVFGDTEAECIAKWNTRISPASAAPVVDRQVMTKALLDAVDAFCGQFDSLGERFRRQLRNAVRAAIREVPVAAATAAPQSQHEDPLKWLGYAKTELETHASWWNGMPESHCRARAEQALSMVSDLEVVINNPASPVKQPLPDRFLCVEPDLQPTVINVLRGFGTDADKADAERHLHLCLRCQGLANAAPVEQKTFKNTKEAMLYAQRNNIPAVVPVGEPSKSARAAAENDAHPGYDCGGTCAIHRR